MCVCVRACVRACAQAYVCVCMRVCVCVCERERERESKTPAVHRQQIHSTDGSFNKGSSVSSELRKYDSNEEEGAKVKAVRERKGQPNL